MRDLKNIHYKELFLYGFYGTFIILTAIAAVVDFIIGSYRDSIIDLIGVVVAYISFYFLVYRQNRLELASVALFWIASGVIFIFVIQNSFDIGVIFTLLLPLVGFILLSSRKAIIHISIYFVLLTLIFSYGYIMFQNHPLLHSMKHMSAYIIAMLFVIAFGFVYHIAIEKSYKELEIANKQKTFLLKEIHHRVKNNLNIISSILGIQKLDSNSKEVHNIIDQNRLRLESMAMAHEILYKCDGINKIEFKGYIQKLTYHILKIESQKDNIKLNINIAPLFLSIEKMIQFGMLINELMTNSIKYAFDKEGIIDISLKKVTNGYNFKYCDNGKGAALDKIKKGFGFSLITMSIEQLNGELKISNNNGLCYDIFFKGLKDENSNS